MDKAWLFLALILILACFPFITLLSFYWAIHFVPFGLTFTFLLQFAFLCIADVFLVLFPSLSSLSFSFLLFPSLSFSLPRGSTILPCQSVCLMIVSLSLVTCWASVRQCAVCGSLLASLSSCILASYASWHGTLKLPTMMCFRV